MAALEGRDGTEISRTEWLAARRVATAQDARRWVIDSLLPVLRSVGTWCPAADAIAAAGSGATLDSVSKHATRYVDVIALDVGEHSASYVRAYDCRRETVAELRARLVRQYRLGRSKGGWDDDAAVAVGKNAKHTEGVP